jgi:hypothetical protein
MTSSDSEAEGRAEVTARWRRLIPALSSEPGDDLTGRANSLERVRAIKVRYRADLERLLPERIHFSISLLSLWSAASYEDRPDFVEDDRFALSVGAPSGLAPWSPELAAGAARALDYALCANVPDKEHLPSGPLFLEGVPLVVRIWKMTQPLARTVGAAAGQP